ncbi:MAG: hypothetical protein Kow00108_16540 [Calditrichia bacterium]
MKQSILMILIFLFIAGTVSRGNSQQLYKHIITNERERRNIYALSDWVGYYNMRHIRWITTDYNYIYFATQGGGIWRYNKLQNRWDYPFTTCNGLPDNNVHFVYFDATQNILICYTDTDTAVFDYGQNIWLSRSQEPFWNYQTTVPTIEIKSPLQKNVFHPGYNGELGQLAFKNNNIYHTFGDIVQDEYLRENKISGFFIDDYNNLFLAIENLGVAWSKLETPFLELQAAGLSDMFPESFYFTNDAIWVGGVGKNRSYSGIVKWDNDNNFQVFTAAFESDIYDDNVYTITGNDSILFFGTSKGLLSYHILKRKWKSSSMASGLIGDGINALQLLNNTLWIGTERGLSKYELRDSHIQKWQKSIFVNQPVYDFTQWGKEQYLVCRLGLYTKKTEEENWAVFPFDAPFSPIQLTAVAANQNEIWVAGEYGIGRYEKEDKRWEFFREIYHQVGPPYHDILITEKAVFIGTDRGFLEYRYQGNKWQHYDISDGLMDNRVYQLFFENGYLWMVTPSGICQFNWKNVE